MPDRVPLQSASMPGFATRKISVEKGMNLMPDDRIRAFLLEEARSRFLNYVTFDTRSNPDSDRHPSSPGQWEFAGHLVQELEALGLSNVERDGFGYVYAQLPASRQDAPVLTFCAHMDTSPAVSGTNVRPVVHENYDGGRIVFPGNPDLVLSPDQCPELRQFVGRTLITASGDTLLGADDKAGIAEIMAALSAFQTFGHLDHPTLRIVFTPDEEIGKGADHIRMEKLGNFGYTIDGGMIGVLEDECFDAVGADLEFIGLNVHPGAAKNRMVNAGALAARFVAALPEYEMPEHAEKREGFFHVTRISGEESRARVSLILRDFDHSENARRVEWIRQLAGVFEHRYRGLKILVQAREQYRNMAGVLARYPRVIQKAERAMKLAGIVPFRSAIRGGTDGARFSFMGMPTPNLFTGGMMFHSLMEWIPEIALRQSAEVIVHLCGLWVEDHC